MPRAERGKAHAAPEGGRGAEQGGAGALLRELVVGPHDVVAAIFAEVVLISAVLPQLVVQLLGVDRTNLLLLSLRHLGPHVLPQVCRVEYVPAVRVHGAPLVPLERLAVLEPLVQGELGAGVLERLWRRQVLLEHIALHILVGDKRLEQRQLVQGALDHDAERAAARAAGRLPLQPPQNLLFRAGDRFFLAPRRHTAGSLRRGCACHASRRGLREWTARRGRPAGPAAGGLTAERGRTEPQSG